jgi:hypothetical protein
MIPSYHQSSVITYPGKSPLSRPAAFITAHFTAIVIFFVFIIPPIRADHIYTPFSQTLPQGITVISFIPDQTVGFLLRPASLFSGDCYGIQGFLREFDFARGRRRKVVPQRNSLAVDHHHPLRALPPLGWPDTVAPFLAGAKLPSINASLQSNCCFSSSSPKKARQILSHTPCSSQTFSRLQQVDAEGYCFGKSAHGAPVRSTHNIPSKTPLLFAQGRPPCFPTGTLGNNASIFSHCASVNRQRVLAINALLSNDQDRNYLKIKQYL